MKEQDDKQTRRAFITKVAYAAPVILSLSVAPSFARNGSGGNGNNGVGNGIDPQPPGNPPVNDGEGTGPGDPGNKGGGKDGGPGNKGGGKH